MMFPWCPPLPSNLPVSHREPGVSSEDRQNLCQLDADMASNVTMAHVEYEWAR